jgi:branched-chain amino acid transport system ATP-binding protein
VFAATAAEPASTNAAGQLECRGLKVHFDGVKAVDGVDVALHGGEILGLIGPNGAGKTTLVNALTGFQRPTAGSVYLDDVEVTGWPPDRLARAGLARTFQAVRLFAGLTVLENVELGAMGVGLGRRDAQRWAWELLGRLGLTEIADLLAASVPHGMERRLAIVRALATRPAFLLLDEPAAGLTEVESDTLMVIEHDMRVIMRLCERIQVLDHGKTISIGTSAEVQSDPAVLKAYLGTTRELDELSADVETE